MKIFVFALVVGLALAAVAACVATPITPATAQAASAPAAPAATASAPITGTAPAAGVSAASSKPAPALEVCVRALELVAPGSTQFGIPEAISGYGCVLYVAKTGFDSDGHPCCGLPIEWQLPQDWSGDYWHGFPEPQGTCSFIADVDPTSGHDNWRVTATGADCRIPESDGITLWLPDTFR